MDFEETIHETNVQMEFVKSIRTLIYNVAFANSERWLAKSRVDITRRRALTQLNVNTENLRFFVLYYLSIKHFRVDIQLYQHEWKLKKKPRNCVKNDAQNILRDLWASCFHTISRFSNFHSCRWKMLYIC